MEIVIETDRLILRKYVTQDVDVLFPILSDPETMKFWPEPYDLEGTREWIKRALNGYEKDNMGRLAMILKSNQKLIGDCGLMKSIVNGREENDLGYLIHHPYHGKGLATEAASAVFEYGKKLGLERIVVNMEDKNISSKRVAEKLGMKVERTFLNLKNRNLQTLLYSWNKVKESSH